MTELAYRPMRAGEAEAVCALVRRVFHACIADEFTEEGAQEFFRYADPVAMRERLTAGAFVSVAERSGEPVGMLEMLPNGHIGLMFVSEPGRGIAAELLERSIDKARAATPELSQLSVNSSLYAVPVYERLGFATTGPATTLNGITFVPMEREIG